MLEMERWNDLDHVPLVTGLVRPTFYLMSTLVKSVQVLD